MKTGRRISAGFTLVEILIVVVILGILAAIVVPKFTEASATAKGSAVQSQLRTIRVQLDLYKLHHNDEYPTLAEMFTNLTSNTEADGTAGDGSADDLGPYLQATPANPFTGGATVAADNSGDWEYDESTGDIRAVVTAALIAELNLSSSVAVAAPTP